MILGKKDKKRVFELQTELHTLKKEQDYQAVKFLNYLHDELGISYNSIAKTLGISQQYVNSICLGRSKVKNESLYKIMSKLFIKE